MAMPPCCLCQGRVEAKLTENPKVFDVRIIEPCGWYTDTYMMVCGHCRWWRWRDARKSEGDNYWNDCDDICKTYSKEMNLAVYESAVAAVNNPAAEVVLWAFQEEEEFQEEM
jgi:hypothetical protein